MNNGHQDCDCFQELSNLVNPSTVLGYLSCTCVKIIPSWLRSKPEELIMPKILSLPKHPSTGIPNSVVQMQRNKYLLSLLHGERDILVLKSFGVLRLTYP